MSQQSLLAVVPSQRCSPPLYGPDVASSPTSTMVYGGVVRMNRGKGWLKSNKITKSGQNRPKNHHFSIQKLPPRDPCRDATEHLTEALGSLDHPPGSTTTSSWSGSALLAASPAQFWSEFRVKEGIRGKSWQWKCWFTQNKHRKFGKIWEIRKSEKLERFLTVSCQGTPATRTPSAGPISTAAVPAVGIKVAIPVVLSWDPQKIS